MKSKQIALTGIFAALYYVLGIVFQPISFMAIQCRIACALIPLIALFGYPATIGITLGGLLFNANSPLGILDMLSMLIFLPAKLAIQKWGIKAVPIHVAFVGIWVGYLLNITFNAPLIPTIVTVAIGELVAEIVLGIPLNQLVKRRLNK